LTNQKDFRPTDEQRDEIVNATSKYFEDSGFQELRYKTQYFETRPLNNGPINLYPGIGITRISWTYVPCSKMTVMAQQMEIENDEGKNEFTFRKWNPNPERERVMWGSDNGNSMEPVCPVFFIFGYLSEILCFRLVFNETIDHCGCGEKSARSIINDYDKS
jgi:hypothetical protein